MGRTKKGDITIECEKGHPSNFCTPLSFQENSSVLRDWTVGLIFELFFRP